MKSITSVWSKYLGNLDYSVPLSGTYFEPFYIENDSSPITSIISSFSDNYFYPQMILLAGQKGTGFTTELNLLSQKLEEEYEIFYTEISKVINVNNITFPDLLLIFHSKLFSYCQENIVRLDSQLVSDIDRFYRIEGVKLDRTGRLIMPDFAELFTNSNLKTKIILNIPLFIELTNKIIEGISKQANRPILFLIDSLEKTSTDFLRETFVDNAMYLAKLKMNRIFTVPITLLHNISFSEKAFFFDEVLMLPPKNLFEKTSQLVKSNYSFFLSIVGKRVPLELFKDDAIEMMIRFSSGIIKDFMRITYETVKYAHYNRCTHVTMKEVSAALDRVAFLYSRSFNHSDFTFLHEIKNNKKLSNTDKEKEAFYLNNNYILEYSNGKEVWYDLHPMVYCFLKDRFDWRDRF